MDYGIRECPKCKRKHSRAVLLTDPLDLDHKSWAIKCDNCQHVGPGAETPEQALYKWNTINRSKMSNYQHIKWHMDKNSMAKFLAWVGDCEVCAYKGKCTLGYTNNYECLEGIKKWLDADLEEGIIPWI